MADEPKLEGGAAEPLGGAAEPPVGGVKEPEDDSIMSFWEHLDELRKRLTAAVLAYVVAVFVAWGFKDPIFAWTYEPFKRAWKDQGLVGEPKLHFAAPSDSFMAYVKLSMIAGALIAAPVIFYEIWAFVAPGLYRKEKRWASVFFVSSTVLFVFGALFAWRAAFPFTFGYFLELTKDAATAGVPLEPTLMMLDYLDFVGQTLLAFGLVFELPLVLTALSMTGLINYLQMYRFGRWFIMIASIIGAIISPPDTSSMIVMTVPLVALYFFSIGLAYIFGVRPTPEQLERDRRWQEDKKREKEERKRLEKEQAARDKAEAAREKEEAAREKAAAKAAKK